MMAYKNKFAVAIKHNGKILRELNDVVNLPFGSEYSIYIKNKNSRKAVVKVEIDGVDVIDGNSIIVAPNSSLELHGFMKGSTVKNRFRFIEKTDRIRKHRGNRIDDGLVRIEYWFEKPPIVYHDSPVVYRGGPTKGSTTYWGHGNSTMTCSFACSSPSISDSYNDDGITVKGSQTRQDFVYGDIGELESSSTVIILKLKGRSIRKKHVSHEGRIVKKPITVKTRLRCTTCGTKSKSAARFCSHCGTFLN